MQALKGSMVSDVETNLTNQSRHATADQRREWDLHERLEHPFNDVLKVMLDHSTSPDIQVTTLNGGCSLARHAWKAR